jgi:serine/threonine protein phosphatase PrpC
MTTTSTDTPGFDLSLLRCAAGTDVGMRREENQDCFGVIKRDHFQAFFIADGMGGARGGATASRMAISDLEEALGVDEVRISADFILSTIKRANRRIFDKGSTEPGYAGMGTTLVGLLFTRDGILSVNVGDSRAYRVRHQNIEQISKDHTLLNELLESGTIDKKDDQGHLVSHMLTRSLGPVAEVEVECQRLPELPENGDIYILCSDGLYNYVPTPEILAVVRQNPIDDASQILINLANQRGGGDNITVLVIAVGDKSPRGRKPTLPYPLYDPYPDYDEEQLNPEEDNAPKTEAGSQQNDVIAPPPVEEPQGRRSQRRSRDSNKPVTPNSPRLIPSVLILGSTLVVGLVLGGLVRKISLSGLSLFEGQRAPEEQQRREQQAAEQPTIQDGNSLATLAKQIRAEQNSGDNSEPERDSQTSRYPEQIQAAIRRLEQQIDTLNSTAKSATTNSLEQVKLEVERLQREYSAIESNLDVASRAVTLWLSRQVALEGRSKVDGSLSEIEQVAAYSGVIKEKLASLSAISYQLRSKADQVELYPNNSALRADLEQLQGKVDQLRRELEGDVRRSLGTILASAYTDYETIKIKRDILWLDLQAARYDLEIQSALADGDGTKRAQLMRTLRERVEAEKRLLADLQLHGKKVR